MEVALTNNDGKYVHIHLNETSAVVRAVCEIPTGKETSP